MGRLAKEGQRSMAEKIRLERIALELAKVSEHMVRTARLTPTGQPRPAWALRTSMKKVIDDLKADFGGDPADLEVNPPRLALR